MTHDHAMKAVLLRLAVLVVLIAWAAPLPTLAGTESNWMIGVGSQQVGANFGAHPGSNDGWDGQQPVTLYGERGIALFLYREHGSDWGGETGFYHEDFEAPIPAGGSKTWWSFYAWSHDYPTDPPNQFQAEYGNEPEWLFWPPAGYIGHLVIDQVPAGVEWTGPMDYWFDMTVDNTFILPVAEVEDPLRGTRFHITVFAPPIPEPSSLLALLAGLASAGVVGARRRRG